MINHDFSDEVNRLIMAIFQKHLCIYICCLWIFSDSHAQTSQIVIIEGSLKLGNTLTEIPAAGTIRWTGLNFEGWTGNNWLPLTEFQIASVITDIDGNEYHSVQIGNQEWMVENLRTTHFQNGTVISQIMDSVSWTNTEEPAWCWFNNDSIYDSDYGKLYNWHAVKNNAICPSGWHVPSASDWNLLADIVGNDNNAGAALKESGFDHWSEPNTYANNKSNFTARPGGLRNQIATFLELGKTGSWWSSNDCCFGALAISYQALHDTGTFETSFHFHTAGNSVRCIKY